MTPQAKVAAMIQPPSLRSTEYQPWSRGRGVDVWAMLCSSITGDVETIRKLVAQAPTLIECEYEYFKPLRFAVRENQRAVVDFLLKNGANAGYETGNEFVTIARERGFEDLAALLEAKRKEQYHVAPGAAAVVAAIKNRNASQVRTLLEKQPELVHAADDFGSQPIHWAVMTRQTELIDYLLERGADVNAARPNGTRPIHLTNGDYNYRGWRDLPATALRHHEVLIGYLLARGAHYDIATATKLGDLDRVRELLDEDPSLLSKVSTYSYYTGLPLTNAAGAGHVEVVKFLLDRGADPNQPVPLAPLGGALHAAIGTKNIALIKLLLDHGANPNQEGESSGNCLSMAKFVNASKEIQELLASHGAVMGTGMADVETLAAMLRANPKLEVAERLGDPPIMELILRHQPDFLKQTPDPTPWWSLGAPKTPEFARWLIERGLDPNRRTWLGVTMLHRCAAKGDIAMAQVFLDAGADIDALETDSCCTPLAAAARTGKKEMVEWLLAKSANRKLPEDEPWALPVEWAKRKGHVEIAKMLE